MPVFNGEKFLKAAIDSILNQTFSDFDFIILNDNSTDTTEAIILAAQKEDSRIILIDKKENIGPAYLRNEGINLANTLYVALMDADDISLPTRFEKQIKVLDENPDIGLCATWFTFLGGKKNKTIKHNVNHDELKVTLLDRCCIGNPTVMFKKNIFGEFHFDNQYVPAEDYDLWSRFISKTNFYTIPESLLLYRWHSSNISKTKIVNLKKSDRAIKINQLSNLGIPADDENIKYYLSAVTFQRGLSSDEIIKTIYFSSELLYKNKQYAYYNQQLFEKHITNILVRTARNASDYNLDYLSVLKSKKILNEFKFFTKMIVLFKSIFKFKNGKKYLVSKINSK